MTESLPAKKNRIRQVLKAWKWIGLGLFIAVLILERWVPTPIAVLSTLLGIAAVVKLVYDLLRILKNRLFWRVRYRMLGAFVFVGLIPLVLMVGMAFLFGYFLFGQLAADYLQSSLHGYEDELVRINVRLSEQLAGDTSGPAFEEAAAGIFRTHEAQFPQLAVQLLRRGSAGRLERTGVFDPREWTKDGQPFAKLPAERFLGEKGSFEGLIKMGKTVSLISLRPMRSRPKDYLAVIAPLDSHLLRRLESEKKIYAYFVRAETTRVQTSGGQTEIHVRVDGEDRRDREAEKEYQTLLDRSKVGNEWLVSWLAFLKSLDPDSGESGYIALALLRVPFKTIYATYLQVIDEQGTRLLHAFYVLIGLFSLVELASMIIGITISRRITQSVNDMYQGTIALKRGDLRHQIPVRRSDQLGFLAESFNEMSASIGRLMEEVVEKKRLEGELEIARQVQARLFPKHLPHPRGLSLFGGCEPASVVSGDYYDFILEDESRLNIVVGDISGKGISAALLMANLQAAMHGQLSSMRFGGSGNAERDFVRVMNNLNSQIYGNSPTEKYATLLLARYDAEKHLLSYCNAGHLPPILIFDGEVKRLDVGGTILGMFENPVYEIGTASLPPGSLLAIYTDGVTEAVNDADEEFGDERLIEALQECRSYSPEIIYKRVLERVKAWHGNMKQQDDITLIIGKLE